MRYNGQAALVADHIHAGPDGRVPQIPGVPRRGEFGREILVALAYQHFITGLPLDTVLDEFSFYWSLSLQKSQADALLNRLAKEWLPEFDALCQLLAVSAVVYADETSWSIHSVWAFLSEQARLTIFGCHKDGQTLDVLLKKDEFQGILVSDDAAVYQGFSRAQKCWALMIRKQDFFNLTHEIVRLLGEEELFTYAIHPQADGTNNESERTLRHPAQDRDTGQTNKTTSGARRRTVISSVLDSLRVHLPQLTLQAVLAEMNDWYHSGVSRFRRMVATLNLPSPSLPEHVRSRLDLLVPETDSG